MPRDLTAEQVASMRFTEHASYDEEAKRALATGPAILSNWREIIRIAPPPADASSKVREELAELHEMKNQRSPETANLVRSEQTLAGFTFGQNAYPELAAKAPSMKRLLDLAINETNPIAFALKKQFDRVRPSTLDPTLNPCIENPGHPSYPSARAARAYIFAYLFSDVDPDQTGMYFQQASEIAIRCEEAGIHFGSDTEAGRELARQIHRALQAVPTYQQHLEAARMEFYDGQLPAEFQPARDPYEILAEQRKQKSREAATEAHAADERKPTRNASPGFLKNLFNRITGD
jgi:acid phosphatase (class A)